MKSKNVFLIVTVVMVIIIVFYAFTGSEDNESYLKEITQEREEKDNVMRSSQESPFVKIKGEFKRLNYFPPDANYRIIANLNPILNKKVIVLNTNDGKSQRYLEYAYAEFELGGMKNKLLILEMMDMGPFRGKPFLAFGDETSARETYGAGRYLDVLKVPGSTTMTLDFNKAYNPYCAYNYTYSCPLPPLENLLKISINAGEKNYH